MSTNGGKIHHRAKLVSGIDRVVAQLLSARAAVEADDLEKAKAAFDDAIESTAALAKDLRE